MYALFRVLFNIYHYFVELCCKGTPNSSNVPTTNYMFIEVAALPGPSHQLGNNTLCYILCMDNQQLNHQGKIVIHCDRAMFSSIKELGE